MEGGMGSAFPRQVGWAGLPRRHLTPPFSFPRLHPEDEDDTLRPRGRLWGGERKPARREEQRGSSAGVVHGAGMGHGSASVDASWGRRG